MIYNFEMNNENSFIEAKSRDLIAECMTRKEISTDISYIKKYSIVTIRDWFPVFHSGYYAIVGFNNATNEFIMSEPIITVFSNSQRIFESPQKYYEILGNYSLKTFEMFQRVYSPEFSNHLIQSMKDFKNGLPKKWIKSIAMLHKLIFCCLPKKVGYSVNVVNNSFEEISNPSSNYIFTETLFLKDMKVCFDEVFELIKINKGWRKKLAKELLSYGNGSLINKLKYKNNQRVPRPDTGLFAPEYISLFLWLPTQDSITEEYEITGYILDDDKNLTEFRFKILYVNITGTHLITESKSVKLLEPICTIKYEEGKNSTIINILADKVIRSFSYGLPHNWRKYVLILEIILQMDFPERTVIEVDGEDCENKENIPQDLKRMNRKRKKN